MGMGVVIEGFLRQAKLTAKYSNKLAESFTLQAIFITPTEQIPALAVVGFMESADFITARSEHLGLRVRLQPGVYIDRILPNRDTLTVQLIAHTDSDIKVREFVVVPLKDNDPRVASNSASNSDFGGQDTISMHEYEFQLLDPGFAKLRNLQVSDNLVMTNVRDAMILTLDGFSKNVKYEGNQQYRGMYLHEPVDNINTYRQVMLPHGTRLIDIPSVLQNHEEYGVYSKGLGSFYKQRYWWVYPLFNTTLADTHHRPIDIVRVPRDKIPTLDETFYISDNALTIIATGTSTHHDRADIRKQNDGVGQRLLVADAVTGKAGYQYSKGKALTTRQDSLQEYKLSDRKSGDEYIPLKLTPTNNVCKAMSENALNEGEFVTVEWHNGDVGYLEPGHPVRYQYMTDDGSVTVRRGVLLGYRSDHVPITSGATPKLKRTCVLTIFLKRQAKYKAT